MTAGRAKRIARGHDPRPDRITVFDRLLESDIVAIARPDITHRGEARIEHRPRIADRGHAEKAVGKFEPAIAADIGRAVEVDVHVDQPRDQGPATQVDVADIGAPFDRAGVGDAGDPPVVADENGGVLDIAASRDIEVAVGSDDAFFGRRRSRENDGGNHRHCCKCTHHQPPIFAAGGTRSRRRMFTNVHTDHEVVEHPPRPWPIAL